MMKHLPLATLLVLSGVFGFYQKAFSQCSTLTVNAGNDTTICASLNKASLNGKVTKATGGKWSGGSGLFIPDNVTLNADYVPSASEIAAGKVKLYLTSTGNGGCTAKKDSVTITIKAVPVPVISGSTVVCENSTGIVYSTPSVSGDSYAWRVLGGTITSGQGTNSITVTWGSAGPAYIYIVETNSAGCTETSGMSCFSKFDFNTNPLTLATIGPNGTAQDADEYSNGQGTTVNTNCGGTKGADVVSPGSTYDKGSMAITVSFRRNENDADFFERGGLKFYETGGVLTVDYRVSNGAGGFTNIGPISSGYTLKNDGYLHSYTFVYDSSSGVARLYTGDTLLVTNTTTANRSLYWTGAGDATMGAIMDGNCSNNTLLDFANMGIPIIIKKQPVANAGSAVTVCAGNSVSIGAAAVSGSTYSWVSSPAGFTSTTANPTVSPLVTTTYTLTETGSNGCTKTNTVIITTKPVPNAKTIANTSICTGSSVSIGGTAVIGNAYSWVSNPPGFISNNANPSVSPTITTIYSVTETGTNGCIQSNSVTITVNALPTAAAGTNASVCSGSATTIGASAVAGSTYSWTSSPAGFTSTSANPTVNPLISTIYTVTETNAAGCTKSNSVTLTTKPLPSALVVSNSSICTGSILPIGGAPVAGSSYSWVSSPAGFSSFISNPSVNPTVTTTYTLTETGSNGCVKSNSVSITVNPLPAAATIINTSICKGASISIGATAVVGSTYSWVSSPVGFTSTASNPSVSPTVTTTYTVTETNSNGCVKANSVVITVNPLSAATTIANTAICTGTSISVGATAVVGSTYSWVSSPVGFTSTSSNPSVSPTVTTTYTVTETNSNGCVKANSVVITVNPLPVAATIANTSICTGTSISVGATTVVGSTYSWVSSPVGFTSTSSNPSVSPTVNTTYTVTETNSNGCVKANSVTITVNPLPAAATIANTSICTGSSISDGATAVVGSTYSWVSNPVGFTSTASNPSVSPTVTTTYTVTETNSNGCVKSNSVVITVNPLPAASTIASSSICTGTSISVGATAVVGSTYSWVSSPVGFTSTASNPSVSPTSTTTYTVTETNSNSCVKSNSVTITVNPLPAAATIANASICTGTSISVGATAVVGSTYSWVSSPVGFTSTASNPSVSPTVTTTYTVTETNSNGCIKSNSVTITVNPLPAATTIANASICTGTSKSIGATAVVGSTYSWVSSPVGFTSTASNPSVSPTVTTTYTITETNSNGCVKSNSVTITVNPLPAATTIASSSICTGISISVGATAVVGSTYSWVSSPVGFTSTASNPSVSPTSTTTYTVTETNSNGCVKSNSVTITVNPLPAATTIASSSICTGTSISVGATAVVGSTYSWVSSPVGFTSTASNPSVSPTSTTTYTVTETNSNGCVKANSVVITVNPLPAATTIASSSICTGTSISVGATAVVGSSYSWVSSPVGFTSTASNPSVSPTVNTTYTVTETNSNGCVKANSVVITVNPLPAAATIGNTAICTGASISVGATAVVGSTYSWVSSPVGFTSTASNPSVSPTVTTTYTVTETNSNGCVKSNAVVITVNPLPAAATIANTAICTGASISVGATAVVGSTYAWVSSPVGFTSTASNPSVSPTVTTTYTVTETNSNGCVKANSVVITVNPLPAATTITNTSICTGTSISVGATAVVGSTYSWVSSPVGFTSTASNPSVSPTVTTTYTVTETNSNSCVKANSVVITVNPLPAAATIANASICTGTSISIGATAAVGSTYSWVSNPVGFTSTASNPSVSPTVTTTYTVTETNSNGCVKANSVTITVNPLPAAATIANASICTGTSISVGATTVVGSTYSWVSSPVGFTSTASNPSVSPTVTTTYTITETNSNGCKKSDSVKITVNPLPAPVISGDSIPCEYSIGEIYTTAAHSGDTFSWTVLGGSIYSGQGSNTLAVNWGSNSGTGLISLTETNSGTGCTKTVTYNVTIFARPLAKTIFH
jgi:hypothetical protein